MKNKPLPIILLSYVALIAVISIAMAVPLTAPSTSMKTQEGRGFSLSIPSNWGMDTFPSGMSFCAAADGKRVTKDANGTNVSVQLGLAAGFRKTNFKNAKDAADQTIRSYQSDNPGLRVIRRETAKLDEFPAESALLESPTGRGGEMERSLMLIVVKDKQMFLAAFTSPAVDYSRLQNVFTHIADSIRLTAWQKATPLPSRTGATSSKKR
jgi:hypothetical protein